MKGIRIVSTGRALPEKVITNDDMSKFVETSDEWITERTGIKQRYQCTTESTVSLALEAAKRAIAKAGIQKEKIGAVITATSTPDYIFPSVSCMLQQQLELSEEVTAFDISAACTGFLYGLQIAAGFVNSGCLMRPYILVIGSEQLSRIIDYTDRGTCILFGDGAGAAIISASDTAYVQRSFTRGSIPALNCMGVGREDNKLHMRGTDVFKFAVKALDQAMNEILKVSGICLDDVDYVVCHQANARIIDHVKKRYPGYESKFYMNIQNYGNTSSASIPIVIDELVENIVASEGENPDDRKQLNLLCVGFGAGLTWSGALISCDVKVGGSKK